MPVRTKNTLRYAARCVHGAEGFRAVAYLDRLAKPPIWTIGFGTTRIRGRPVQPTDTCTLEEAELWSADDMFTALTFVLRKTEVDLDDWQAAALTSLTYNIGHDAFADSSVLAALNQGHYRTAADCFLEYDHAGGVQIHGLMLRRQRERAMFLAASPSLAPAIEPAPLSEADALNQKQLDQAPPLSEADVLNQREIDRLKGLSDA